MYVLLFFTESKNDQLSRTLFSCKDGLNTINTVKVCDGTAQCKDSSDEDSEMCKVRIFSDVRLKHLYETIFLFFIYFFLAANEFLKRNVTRAISQNVVTSLHIEGEIQKNYIEGILSD